MKSRLYDRTVTSKRDIKLVWRASEASRQIISFVFADQRGGGATAVVYRHSIATVLCVKFHEKQFYVFRRQTDSRCSSCCLGSFQCCLSISDRLYLFLSSWGLHKNLWLSRMVVQLWWKQHDKSVTREFLNKPSIN